MQLREIDSFMHYATGFSESTYCGIPIRSVYDCTKSQVDLVTCPACMKHPNVRETWAAIERIIGKQYE